jgi:hypothetical protein
MAFGNAFKQGAQRVSRFFSSQVPTAARTGMRLFSTHVLPAARTANKLINAVGEEVQTSKAGEKVKGRVKQVSSLANIGLQRLEDTHKAVGRISDKMGFA